MALTQTVRARVDEQLKKDVEIIFNELGINTSQAINIFLKKVVSDKGIPFEMKIPTKQLQKAIEEARNNNGSTNKNIDDLMKDLKS
jgi:DNA-damage-inducible protein J